GQMLSESYKVKTSQREKLITVEEYLATVPNASLSKFKELSNLVKDALPNAEEVLSYGIIGYKIDDKRARVYISGWKDHVAMYPLPKGEALTNDLKPYIKGKGTLRFPLNQPLPKKLIEQAIKILASWRLSFY